MNKKSVFEELAGMKKIPASISNRQLKKWQKDDYELLRIPSDDKKYEYYCTNCGNYFYPKSMIKLKTICKCPNCHKRGELKSINNKFKPIHHVYSVLDQNRRGELIMRIVYDWRVFDKEILRYKSILCTEVFRKNLERGICIKKNLCADYFSRSINPSLTNNEWKLDNSNWIQWFPTNESVFAYGVDIKDSPRYKYSAVDRIVKDKGFKKVHVCEYLELYDRDNRVELFTKGNKYTLVEELQGWKHQGLLKSLDRDDIRYISKCPTDLCTTEGIETHRYLRSEDYALLRRAISLRYIHSCRKASSNTHIKNINYLFDNNVKASDYFDYLRMAHELGDDLSYRKNRYPIHFMEAHDKCMERYKVYQDKLEKEKRILISEKIKEYAKELESMRYEDSSYLIRPASSREELENESNVLHHCVRTYDSAVAERRKSIFFVRKADRPDIPFVTLELQKDKVIQCRGMRNAEPDDNTISFVNHWCRNNNFVSCFS